MNVSFMVSNVFSDHMIFQRNRPIKVWGCASPCTTIRGEMNDYLVEAVVDENGRWIIEFPALEAGGPYEMVIKTQYDAEKRIKDILIGEVWVCSGQSNMEYSVYLTRDPFYSLGDEGKKLCECTKDDKLRLLHVKHAINQFEKCDMLPECCEWKSATSFDGIAPISGVGFLFSQMLRKKYPDIPVGIISSSWGGSIIQPWIDKESFVTAGETAILESLETSCVRFNEPRVKTEEELKRDDEFFAWIDRFNAYAPEISEHAISEWTKLDADTSDWEEKPFKELSLSRVPGIAWYRKIIEVSEEWAGSDLFVYFGALNDEDEVFFDGVKIGETTCRTREWWEAPRKYNVDKALTTPGKHVVAVRIKNHKGIGGFMGEAFIRSFSHYGKVCISEGSWLQKQEFVVDFSCFPQRPEHIPDFTNITNSVPTCLYNAMIHPLTKLEIRGALWYQGCSNAGEPANYYRYNKLLVESWRKAWNNPKMPFIITQLSAFQEQRPFDRLPDDYWKDFEPSNEGYQGLREVQKRVAEDMDNVGIAITIDVGDHSDIHPKNKWDVAKRLFACAEKIAYGEDVPYLCPDCTSVLEQDGGLLLKINNVGEGLYLKDAAEIGEHMFAIAGADGVYKWADAKLVSKDEIFVSSAAVTEPKTVRYAWSAFPPFTNIYSSDNLPLQPFRTDNEKVY